MAAYDDDDLDDLDEVGTTTPDAKMGDLGKAGVIRQLERENQRLREALEKGLAEAAAAGYLKALETQRLEEGAIDKLEARRGSESVNTSAASGSPPIDTFHKMGGAASPYSKIYTGGELQDAFQRGEINNAEIKALLDAGRVDKTDHSIVYHNW